MNVLESDRAKLHAMVEGEAPPAWRSLLADIVIALLDEVADLRAQVNELRRERRGVGA